MPLENVTISLPADEINLGSMIWIPIGDSINAPFAGTVEGQVSETGKTVIIITHNQELTKMADRVFGIRNGKVVYEAENDDPTPVEELVW